jgi:GNAT superfamily N-acetyltransferase
LSEADRARLTEFMTHNWGTTQMAGHGQLFNIPELAGFVAESDGSWVGCVAYLIEGETLEIVWLGSTAGRSGAGSALVAACARLAKDTGLSRIWLITTNDNLDALRFYQRRGFHLIAIHPGAVDQIRESVKPEIPLVGSFGIPMRDEIQLELPMAEWDDIIEHYAWPST